MFLGDSTSSEAPDSPVGREDEEEMLLKQAIALSLEGAEENDNEEEDSNSDEAEDLDEKPDPYSFSDEDENANNSTLGDDGEESIKAEEIEDPAGVR